MKLLRHCLLHLVLFLGVVALAGCRERADPVRETLDRIVRSTRDRDPKGVAAQLTADYRDAAGNGVSDVEGMLRGYFAAYQSVEVTLNDLSIERSEGAARARFRVDLSGKPRESSGLVGLVPSAESYRFDVRLTPDDAGWKVAWAAWEPVAR
ncbi:MAG TPA: hypothetical protein VMR54_04620 [Thermoanaerobaculia bacterium]|nr:hypothetical protein [Thermoanaerobaculia bacterium]